MRLCVAAGGTGGHIYPALAIARAAVEAGVVHEVRFVGARGGMEERLVPAAGFPLHTLPVRGMVRKRPAEWVRAAAGLGVSVVRAANLLRGFRPDVVLGTGGYAAGPLGAAAAMLRIPLVLQEQNTVPGVTNRLLASHAARIAIPYPAAAARFPSGARLVVTGNPVRPELLGVDPLAARRRLGLEPGGRVVLMVAGSRGSAVFVRWLADLAAGLRDGTLLFVSGGAHHEAAQAAAAGRPRVRVVPYLEAMGDGLAAADLVVARAGAIFLAELAAVGRPALLVPSPHVTHHHQEVNAEVFEQAGAAEVLSEIETDGAILCRHVTALLADPQRRQAMAAAARSLARPRALADLVGLLAEAARSRGKAR